MPLYEYDCRACGPFAEMRPMAASARPAACPRCAASSPRVLSATAIGRAGRGARARRSPEPSLVKSKAPRDPPKRQADPLKAARRRADHHGARPWMIGH
jgi:putative FmdB family regulatory protein